MTENYLYEPDGQLSIGQPAPIFNLLDTVSGKNVSIEKYRGKSKALCVIFSCNHCPWVIKYEERLIALGKEYSDKGVGIVIISSNDVAKYPQDGPAAMMKRAAEKGYPFPYLFDQSQDVAHAYGAQVTPHVFLFDGDLILRYRGGIDDNAEMEARPTRHYLKDAIDSIFSGNNEISITTTRAVGCGIKWK